MSFGLLVIAINIGYLIFSIIAGITLSKLLKKVKVFKNFSTYLLAIVTSLFILLTPFYDLLIQKGIKTYYEAFDKTYAKIYAYPEKDSKGRVESISRNRWFGKMSINHLTTDKAKRDFKNIVYPKIKDFTENYFYGSLEENKEDFGYARVYLNKNPITYERITGINDFKARYQILTKVNQHWFYKEMETSFWDKKTKTLLAQTVEIAFPVRNKKNKFRYKYLHQHGANGGGGIGVKGIYGLDNEIYRKLFDR